MFINIVVITKNPQPLTHTKFAMISSFESVIKKILDDPNWAKKLLIGIIISFIPIVNILALGYVYRYANQVRREHVLTLPQWDYWMELIFPGLYFFAVGFFFYMLPILIGCILGQYLSIFYLISIAGILAGPAFFASALKEFQASGENFRSLLNFQAILDRVQSCWRLLIIPSLCFAALYLLLWIHWILWSVAFFVGMLFYLAFAYTVYLENRKY
jgi:hypothetical protein